MPDIMPRTQSLTPSKAAQMSRFNGDHGELFGSPVSGEIGTQ
jgi:hypothetical protein